MDSKIVLVDDKRDIADLIEQVLHQQNFQNIRKNVDRRGRRLDMQEISARRDCFRYYAAMGTNVKWLPTVGGLVFTRKTARFIKTDRKLI